jgi:hypothetical protein
MHDLQMLQLARLSTMGGAAAGCAVMSDSAQDSPLDYIDFDDILQHGDPSKWTFLGSKQGSGVPATSPLAQPGTTKHYDIYEDEFGDQIEIHYFRHADGSIGDVKIKL